MTKQALTPRFVDVLSFICSLKPKRRSGFILKLDKQQINCIAEVFSNFLKKNLTTEKSIIKRLKRHREAIKEVSRKKTSLKKKKKILSSRTGGNILSILLPLAINAFTSLI